jgi:hypothetical protein
VANNPDDMVFTAKDWNLPPLALGDFGVNEKILKLLATPQPQGAEAVAGFAASESKGKGDPVQVHNGFVRIVTEFNVHVRSKYFNLQAVIQRGQRVKAVI